MYHDAEWLALAARSESDQPHEWPAIMWVIRNRRDSRGYPSTYQGVITQAWQFSYFNPWRGEVDAWDMSSNNARIFNEAKEGYAGDDQGWDENDYDRAVICARRVLGADRSQCPFSHRVLNFWSPISMEPAYSLPKWRWNTLRVFAMSGVNPHRFLFAEATEYSDTRPIGDIQTDLLGLTQRTFDRIDGIVT